jgi:hypothetical protein
MVIQQGRQRTPKIVCLMREIGITQARQAPEALCHKLKLEHEMVVRAHAPVGNSQAIGRIQFAHVEHRFLANQMFIGNPIRLEGEASNAPVR